MLPSEISNNRNQSQVSAQAKQPHDTREGHMSVFSRFPTRTLFVRDLPYSCTSQDLKNFFSEELGVYISRALVCDNRQQKPLHFGYVLLPDEEIVAVAVQKLNGRRFRGRDMRVEAYKATVMLETANMGAIHVTFKAQSARMSLITEATLREYFETFGEIQQIVIRKHELTEDGRQHGFAFVTFRLQEINEKVIETVRKYLVGEILYDCAWSKQYLESIRKDHNGGNNHSQQVINASSDSNPMDSQSPFKGTYTPLGMSVSRAGSMDLHDHAIGTHSDVARGNFYSVGAGTPNSLSFDTYDNTTVDTRWMAPASSLDQSSHSSGGFSNSHGVNNSHYLQQQQQFINNNNASSNTVNSIHMDGMVGSRRGENASGQTTDISNGIAFSKLFIGSAHSDGVPHTISYDHQEVACHPSHLYAQPQASGLRNVPTPPPSQQLSVNVNVNSRGLTPPTHLYVQPQASGLRNVPTPPPSQQLTVNVNVNSRGSTPPSFLHQKQPPQTTSQLDQVNSRLMMGMKKQYSAPQSTLEFMQLNQRRVIIDQTIASRHGNNASIPSRSVDGSTNQQGTSLSSWSMDMMDEYSSVIRGNDMSPSNLKNAHFLANQLKTVHKGTRNINISNNVTNNNSHIHNGNGQQQYPPQHPSHVSPSNSNMQQQYVYPINRSPNVHTSNMIHSNRPGTVFPRTHHMPAFTFQQSANGNYISNNNFGSTNQSNSSASTVSTPSSTVIVSYDTSTNCYHNNFHNNNNNNSISVQAYSPQHYSNHPSYTSPSSTISSMSKISTSMSHDALDDYHQQWSLPRQLNQSNNNNNYFHINSNNNLKHQQVENFPQVGSSPAESMGVPRTQSDSAIGFSLDAHLISSFANNIGSDNNDSRLADTFNRGMLPPRDRSIVTCAASANNISVVNHSTHHQQQQHSHSQYTQSSLPTLLTGSFSGSNPASLNNSYQNSFDENDAHHSSFLQPLHHNNNNLTLINTSSSLSHNLHYGGLQQPSQSASKEQTLTNLDLNFITAPSSANMSNISIDGTPSAVSSTSTLSTPVDGGSHRNNTGKSNNMRMMMSKRGLEKLIMYDELLTSDSGPKDTVEDNKNEGIYLGDECNSISQPDNGHYHPSPTLQSHGSHHDNNRSNNNNNNNQQGNTLGSISLFSLSDSSYSPRLDNSRSIASLASFSIDPPSTCNPHTDAFRLQMFLLNNEEK